MVYASHKAAHVCDHKVLRPLLRPYLQMRAPTDRIRKGTYRMTKTDQQERDYIFTRTAPLWEDLRGKRVFLTGGTGFFGAWMLPAFTDANARLDLKASVVVLTRNSEAFAAKMPEVASNPAVAFQTGDVRDFAFPPGHFDYVIHAATDASAQLNTEEPLKMIDVVADGTRRALEFTRRCGARRFLLTSSGAVYGRLPAGMTHVSEEFTGGPDTMGHPVAYAEGKRFAEALTGIYARTYGFEAVVVRSFAVVGPHLPLDIHFAMGNFIRDGLRGGPITVGGGTEPRAARTSTARTSRSGSGRCSCAGRPVGRIIWGRTSP